MKGFLSVATWFNSRVAFSKILTVVHRDFLQGVSRGELNNFMSAFNLLIAYVNAT